jgi:hypothetical protein
MAATTRSNERSFQVGTTVCVIPARFVKTGRAAVRRRAKRDDSGGNATGGHPSGPTTIFPARFLVAGFPLLFRPFWLRKESVGQRAQVSPGRWR